MRLVCRVSQKMWSGPAALSEESPRFTAAWNGTSPLLRRSDAQQQREVEETLRTQRSWWHVGLARLPEWQLWMWSCQAFLWQAAPLWLMAALIPSEFRSQRFTPPLTGGISCLVGGRHNYTNTAAPPAAGVRTLRRSIPLLRCRHSDPIISPIWCSVM